MRVNEISRRFSEFAYASDDAIDLAEAAFLVAATAYPGIDMTRQLGLLDSLASAAGRRVGQARDPLEQTNALSEFLFDEIGFQGNREDYYDPRNSFLNDVLKRRLGIPITLSLVYIEVGKRLGLPLVGVGLPGHFLVRHRQVADHYVDPFHEGILLSVQECAARYREASNPSVPWDEQYLAPVTNLDFVTRILQNLKGAYLRLREYETALEYSGLLLDLRPDVAEERRDRGLVLSRMGKYAEAIEDLRSYLGLVDDGPETVAVEKLIERLDKRMRG